jgi:hypothetical protein
MPIDANMLLVQTVTATLGSIGISKRLLAVYFEFPHDIDVDVRWDFFGCNPSTEQYDVLIASHVLPTNRFQYVKGLSRQAEPLRPYRGDGKYFPNVELEYQMKYDADAAMGFVRDATGLTPLPPGWKHDEKHPVPTAREIVLDLAEEGWNFTTFLVNDFPRWCQDMVRINCFPAIKQIDRHLVILEDFTSDDRNYRSDNGIYRTVERERVSCRKQYAYIKKWASDREVGRR